MEEPEPKQRPAIKLGNLELEFYAELLDGVGLGIAIAKGVCWQSVRFEVTLLMLYFGFHAIWNNPDPEQPK